MELKVSLFFFFCELLCRTLGNSWFLSYYSCILYLSLHSNLENLGVIIIIFAIAPYLNKTLKINGVIIMIFILLLLQIKPLKSIPRLINCLFSSLLYGKFLQIGILEAPGRRGAHDQHITKIDPLL